MYAHTHCVMLTVLQCERRVIFFWAFATFFPGIHNHFPGIRNFFTGIRNLFRTTALLAHGLRKGAGKGGANLKHRLCGEWDSM